MKILALEKPERYGSHPIYLTYLQKLAQDDFKKNPYMAILRETCVRWCEREGKQREDSRELSLGVRDGIVNSLVLSNSDETSIDGEIRSGNLNSYVLRLSSKESKNVHEFSINSFLKIDYELEKMFSLKPREVLERRLE